MTYTVTPPAGAPTGEVGSFTYTATDPYGQFSTGTVQVTVQTPPPNLPPTASNITATLTHGTPTSIDLDLVAAPGPYVSDPESNPLTIEVQAVSSGLTVVFSNATLVLTITSTDGLVDAPRSFQYRVNDGTSYSSWATVDLTVVICKLFGSPGVTPASASRARSGAQNRLASDVTYVVSYTGPCGTLVLYFDHDGIGAFETLVPKSTATVSGHQEATFEIKGPGGLKDWIPVASPGRGSKCATTAPP